MEVYPPTNVRKNFVPTTFWQIFKLSPPILMGRGRGMGGAETMIMSENITYNSTAIDCFFEYFNAQIQSALFTMVITFPDDKIMLN